jgi:hypothetical protein
VKLAECLRLAIADQDLRDRIAASGLTSARTRFSTDALISNVQSLYASLL